MTTRNIPLARPVAAAKRPDAIRVAQIGLAGGIGYAHINEHEKNHNFRLVAGHDLYPTEPRVAEAITRLKSLGAKIHPTFDAVLADPNVDAVDICAPHHFHRPMAVAAMRAGKHVLVEKPMATHPDDVEAMLAAQRETGKVAAVQMQHVGRSSMLHLREALQSGAIGRIREVFLSSLWWRTDAYYARIPWAGRKQIDGHWCLDGALFNQCVHYITQTLTLLSPGPLPSVARVKNLAAALYKFHDAPTLEVEDTAFIRATLDTPDAPTLIAVGTTCSTEDRHSIDILGDNGRALWNGAGYLMIHGQPVQEFRDDNREFDGNSRIFDSFAEAIRTPPQSPSTSAPLTDIRHIQNVTRFVTACYDACGGNIRKAPWSATETLFTDVIAQVQAQRKLPAELRSPPAWA